MYTQMIDEYSSILPNFLGIVIVHGGTSRCAANISRRCVAALEHCSIMTDLGHRFETTGELPSGHLTYSYGESPFLICKSSKNISNMMIFIIT